MKRLKIAQFIALGATLCTVLGVVLGGLNGSQIGSTIMYLGMLVGMISYFFGGFGTAMKMSAGIAKWGWFLAPFPIDIVTFIFAFILAIVVFFFLPIIPVRKAYKNSVQY